MGVQTKGDAYSSSDPRILSAERECWMPVQRWTGRERRLLGGLQEVPLGHLGGPRLNDDPLYLTMKLKGTRTPQDLG